MEAMASYILPIDQPSVHRITSGQVVTDLQTAIKELVENALDAGSTSVEIRFKDFGLELIEVIDNGSGINKVDYPSIALKHHTSKLTSFADLSSVSSFGFRGEALSSLCALSESVEVVTATQQEAPLGTIVTFNRLGQVVDSTKTVARTRGTTITIRNIFQPVPVRRYEFNKNAKREFAKALHLLNAYALVGCLTGMDVRLLVVGIGKGKGSKRTVHLQTTSSTSLKNTISALWGPKASIEMQPILLELELTDQDDLTTRMYTLKGMISLDSHGRSSPDRQFYSINGRPCNTSKLAKMINEVYRSTNPNQSPVVILDLQLPKTACDVNVTADKRTIFLHDETDVIDGFRSKLLTFFSHSSSNSFPLPRSSTQTELQDEPQQIPDPEETSAPSTQSNSMTNQRSYERSDAGGQISILSMFDKRSPEREEKLDGSTEEIEDRLGQHDVGELDTQLANDGQLEGEEELDVDDLSESVDFDSPIRSHDQRETLGHRQTPLSFAQDQEGGEEDRADNKGTKRKVVDSEEDHSDDDDETDGYSNPGLDIPELPIAQQEQEEEEEGCAPLLSRFRTHKPHSPTSLPSPPVSSQATPRRLAQLPQMALRYSFSSVHSYYRHLHSSCPTSDIIRTAPTVSQEEQLTEDDLQISDIRSSAAEETLNRIVLKSDFKQMSVLGQFNLGFIITSKRGREGGEDLFIVDQHAADEKVNFELLQINTKIQSQKLIRPRPLELSAVDTVLVQDNLPILRKNGFDVEFSSPAIDHDDDDDDEEAESGPRDNEEGGSWNPTRVSLCAQPVSKETVFDFQDLEELLHLIRESPLGEMVRCSKARRMFASRACRKSIMVGKPLTKRQMLKVLENMGRIDQPWNCPHGRPTMRHLTHLGPPKRMSARKLNWDHFYRNDDN